MDKKFILTTNADRLSYDQLELILLFGWCSFWVCWLEFSSLITCKIGSNWKPDFPLTSITVHALKFRTCRLPLSMLQPCAPLSISNLSFFSLANRPSVVLSKGLNFSCFLSMLLLMLFLLLESGQERKTTSFLWTVVIIQKIRSLFTVSSLAQSVITRFILESMEISPWNSARKLKRRNSSFLSLVPTIPILVPTTTKLFLLSRNTSAMFPELVTTAISFWKKRAMQCAWILHSSNQRSVVLTDIDSILVSYAFVLLSFLTRVTALVNLLALFPSNGN